MKSHFFDQAFEKTFEWYGNEKTAPGTIDLLTETNRKRWNFFCDSYYFIIDHHALCFEMVSPEVKDVLGYSPAEFDIPFMNSKIHPDDQSWFLAIGARIISFFSGLSVEKLSRYKVRYDLRFSKKNGEYARLLYQGILLEHDAKGRFLRTLNQHTDISYLKQEGRPVLSFIGMDGEPSFVDVALDHFPVENREELTERERQVLKLLIEGKLSKEIAEILHISKQTVDTHRKNMLHKKKLTNTGELIGKSIRQGWI